MEGKPPASFAQRDPENGANIASRRTPSEKSMHNISVQTGEEFSMEFLQDRMTPKGTPRGAGLDQSSTKRGGNSANHNQHPTYEDLTRNLGIRRLDSDCNCDVSNASLAKGHVIEASSNSHRVNENSESGYQQLQHHVSDTSDSSNSGKIKFLCSFGGTILPRPSDGKLRYVGGEKKIISIKTELSLRELMQKTFSICQQPHIIKYQLPGEDLDALISVSSDEDLQNMIEEYYGLEKADGSQRIRIFLISLNELESSSLDTRSLQNSSEYQYVVAVNNIPDPSPKKSLSGNSLSNQIGYHLDGSPTYHKDSHLLQPDFIDGTGAQNHVGMFVNQPTSEFFFNSQFPSKSPNQSPPFSPNPVQQRENKHCRKESFEDHFVADQSSDNYYGKETGHFQPWAVPRPHPDMHFDAVQVQNHRYMREIPPSFIPKDSDMDGYGYCDKSVILERGFHSEMIQRQQENSQNSLSGSNDMCGPVQAIPHAYSDPLIQEKIEMVLPTETTTSNLDFTTSQIPPNIFRSNLQEGTTLYRQNTDLNHPPNLPHQLQGTESRISQPGPEVSSSHYPESYGRNEFRHHILHNPDAGQRSGEMVDGLNSGAENSHVQHLAGTVLNRTDGKGVVPPQDRKFYHNDTTVVAESGSKVTYTNHHPIGVRGALVSSQGLEALESSVPSYSVNDSNSCSNAFKDYSLGNQLDTPEIHNAGHKYTNYKYHESYEPLKGDLVPEGNNTMSFSPRGAWPKNSTEMHLPATSVDHMDVGDSVEIPSDLISSSNPLSHLPPGIMSQNMKDDHIHRVVNAAITDPIRMVNDTGLNLNMHGDNLWSVFQSSQKDQGLRREVSLLDQDILPYPNTRVLDYANPGSKFLKGGDSESVSNVRDHVPMETEVTVEDVTDSVPSGVPVCPPIVPHVLHESAEDDVETGASNTPHSECDDANSEEREMDKSISVAANAEIEAGMYGLQIIKNADLEELRELGSGTFGTVYHGKWRGTDVAIKRIKKSCFAGRSSEQERLTKDFWREAQILSKLHHPNVVAFYGVVPDGTGGTLATVTEFMVNGSLRHVLVRKDRALDRRKRLIIVMDAAFGMEYLHSKNIVHFDLKCDNLLVNLRDSQRPICKVGDFGLSRIKRNTLVSGGVRGTLPWMAPELLNGSSIRVSEKVDVFSFGIAMWEILTGEEPYANMHCGAIIGGIMNNSLRPPIPERCDPDWRKLMEECWSPDPSIRPSFTEITNRLRAMSLALQPKGHTNR
ncbi:putative serine/threonine-protein kinase roco5 isoform X1 [Iris pallida]|uniref:Serine/threonine-protein kinase roco5 isoform X1 n=1 Tax=Iris pallida TaxID=29817 RepID=A0AAX6EPD3_IRIPA|nr:putative serine/threonine-protein kinase roco5 isoform X1 [Iris pallida]